jgi:hypothetical protein
MYRYQPPKHPQHDLALVKVSKPINFSSKIMPICVPFNEEFPDERGIVYEAGWSSSSPSRESECTTGDKGPDPFSKCKFPFFIDKGSMSFSDCIITKSPSHKNKGCWELYTMVTKKEGNNAGFLDKRVNTKVLE